MIKLAAVGVLTSICIFHTGGAFRGGERGDKALHAIIAILSFVSLVVILERIISE